MVEGTGIFSFHMLSEIMVILCSVPVDTRRIVYTAAVASGTEEDWDFLWKRFQSTPVASEKNLILAALGSTQDPWLIQR